MCGIVGYIGDKNAAEVLIDGLQRLEYRGYDSAGIAVLADRQLRVMKRKGNVSELRKMVDKKGGMDATIGIGHTRWATHGDPDDANAHPHVNTAGDIAIVHNGIVENHSALRTLLTDKGYVFQSSTDSEVIAHLIDSVWEDNMFLEDAVSKSLCAMSGAYGLCVISSRDPDKIVVARKGSPLVIGVGDGVHVVASDGAPLAGSFSQVEYLHDGELAIITRDGYELKTLETKKNRKKHPEPFEITLQEIEKGGFPHFMLKEIFEQTDVIRDVMRGRVRLDDKDGDTTVRLGGIEDHIDCLKDAKRIIICACGTSWHAALVGEYVLEKFTRVPVEIEYASEFRYRDPVIMKEDVVIVISQSGETADTRAALQLAKERGATVMGVVNAVGSTIARETDFGIYLHAGPEIGVASTKAFTGQVVVLTLLALILGREKSILSEQEIKAHLVALSEIPDKIERILNQDESIQRIAKRYSDARNFLYLGRGYHFPVALEGALKLKEISYIHAEGYPAAEMKHGPIALIDEEMPVVVIGQQSNGDYDKVVSNTEEIRARKGRIIAIVTEGDEDIRRLARDVIFVPNTLPALTPLLSVIPLQLLAYHIAVLRGCSVDRPRNLAKSVTVE
ncbi:MAG: glutamine--fructose-6-phosphate transaminase (isomerizing) [Parcubacteria group bacterium]|nr:glutamine--fructose-6-phosphate transaminase (isomerizing) [Parcubacteria group bacterium]